MCEIIISNLNKIYLKYIITKHIQSQTEFLKLKLNLKSQNKTITLLLKLLGNEIISWRTTASRNLDQVPSIRVVLSSRNGGCELSCQQHDVEIIQRYKLPAKRARFLERSIPRRARYISRIYCVFVHWSILCLK